MGQFHDIRFPLALTLGVTAGPERRTEIVTLASGAEQRNALWSQSRRRYDVGQGLRSLEDISTLLAFFEARCGRLYGFRFRDPLDHRSCLPGVAPSATDQLLGHGDGIRTVFPLIKTYASGPAALARPITRPVLSSLRVALAGVSQSTGWAFADGAITFATPPGAGVAVTAGYEFDTPVRFDTDSLQINLAAFRAGEVPSVPLIETRD